MRKILIVNLRRLGDVYSTGHLINSLTQSGRVEVSLLVYKESVKAAKNLANVKNIYTIDREELITINSNKLFADTLSLDHLYDSLAPIKKDQWHTVINFSNDTVGAYLCSYFSSSAENTIGVHFNANRNIETNSVWEVIFNDVLTSVKYSPMHFVDCYHRMLQIPVALTGNKIKTSPDNDQMAMENISAIRNETSAGTHSKVIAIQAYTSKQSKNISPEIIKRYIHLLKQSEDIIPMIIIAPNNEERNFANQINEAFDNNLIVVESDLNALGSVLQNVDLVVTPDTAIKHIADLCETPVLEISIGESPFLKQGAYTTGSLILSDIISNRSFKSGSNEISNITAEDIFVSTIYHFSNTKNIKPRLSNNVTLYKTSRDSIGAAYIPIAGSTDAQSEIQRLMARQFISTLMDNSSSNEIYEEISKMGTSQATEWCNNEKAIITNIMKDLLGTLRSLLLCIETKRSSRDFIMNLGKLISHCEEASVTQIATIIFKTKIESINARSFEENAKEVEVLLYELKSYVQKNLNCLKELEDRIQTQKKEDLLQRNGQTIGQ